MGTVGTANWKGEVPGDPVEMLNCKPSNSIRGLVGGGWGR